MILEVILIFGWLFSSDFSDFSLWYYNSVNTEIIGDEIHIPGISLAGEIQLVDRVVMIEDALGNTAELPCNAQNVCEGSIARLSASAKWYFEGISEMEEYDRMGAKSVQKQGDFVVIDFGGKMPDFPIKMQYPRYE